MKYHQPYGVADPNASFVNGDPSIGRQGSIPDAQTFENPQREIINLILAANIVPADSDLFQLLKAARTQAINYAIDTGSANAYSVAYTPALDSYSVGQPFRVKILNANTGASTFNAGCGAHPIKLSGGADLAANELVAGMIADLVWDGTNFQLTNSTVGGGGGGTTNNFTIKIPYIADTSGAPNVITAPFSPAITAPVDGDPILVKIANANSGATQITVNALSAANVVNRDGSALTIGALVAGQMALMVRSGSTWQLYGSVAAGGGGGGGGSAMAGYSGLVGSAPGATKTAAWTAGEIVAENTLGGTPFKAASLSLAFNGAGTGANGMDTGSTPNSADLSIYAIYNPTSNTWGTLGCLGSVSNGVIYSGAHLPSGYAASVLIWSGKTDINGNILQFLQYDREIDVVPVYIFGAPGGSVTGPPFSGGQFVFGAVSISNVAPANAKFASGILFGDSQSSVTAVPTTLGNPASLTVPLSGLGTQMFYNDGGSFKDLRLSTAQTVYWSGNGTSYTMAITGYRI